MVPKLASKLTEQQKKEAWESIQIIKENPTGKIKECHCTNGRKQRGHVPKEKLAYLRDHLELVFIAFLINAK